MGVEIGARIYKLNTEFVEICYLNENNVDEFKKVYFHDGVTGSRVFVTGPSKEFLQITTDDFTVLADVKLEICDIVYIPYTMDSDHSIILKLFIILDDHDYNYIKEKIS